MHSIITLMLTHEENIQLKLVLSKELNSASAEVNAPKKKKRTFLRGNTVLCSTYLMFIKPVISYSPKFFCSKKQ